jgi:ribosomal protein L11
MDKMNKPTRLRSIIARHIEEINPNADHSKVDALEDDIKTFVKSIVHGADELGLRVECQSYLGDLD